MYLKAIIFRGQTGEQGFEHAVDGGKDTSELHFLRWNSDKYASRAEAFDKPDTLAIVTVFLKLGSGNENLKDVLKALDSVKTKGKQAPFSNFDPASLLPKSLDYWTYNGSLTHPPLHESVIWIILKEPITTSSEQLAHFCALLSSAEGERPCPILSDHQPRQPLKSRVVRSQFQPVQGSTVCSSRPTHLKKEHVQIYKRVEKENMFFAAILLSYHKLL
nr:PREDICTED: carbonic anhydrase 1 {ECO:0000250/UniProtKB:P00915}-like [Struthio camelus australis]